MLDVKKLIESLVDYFVELIHYIATKTSTQFISVEQMCVLSATCVHAYMSLLLTAKLEIISQNEYQICKMT